MDDTELTYKFWRIRKTVMQVSDIPLHVGLTTEINTGQIFKVYSLGQLGSLVVLTEEPLIHLVSKLYNHDWRAAKPPSH